MLAILVVEDEAIVANDIKETLIGLGYTVVGTAKTGESALEKVRETSPGLVLMDIHLAGAMDGIEAAGGSMPGMGSRSSFSPRMRIPPCWNGPRSPNRTGIS